MQRNVAGGSGEIAIIVVAAVALTGFIALVACCLCQFLGLLLQQPVQSSSTLPRTNSFNCPLIISSLNCTIFSDMACLLLSECFGVVTLFYQSLQAMSFYFSILRNLLYLIIDIGPVKHLIIE